LANKSEHLGLIQAVVSRLAGNSFVLKGWSVVLVSAFFALAAKDTKPAFALLAFFPALALWLLDGYFLWQERRFRGLYDKVRLLDEAAVDFSMNTGSLDPAPPGRLSTTFSSTLLIFHGAIVLSIAVVLFLLLC